MIPLRGRGARALAAVASAGLAGVLGNAAIGVHRQLVHTAAIELKRRGDIDGVEQLTRYLELLNRDPLLAPVRGIFAAQEIKPQARKLAEDRGIECLVLDYDSMRGIEDSVPRLF